MDRGELVARLLAGRADLEAALRRVEAGRMEDVVLHGDWSVKDLLAHLAFWERRVVAFYQALADDAPWRAVKDDAGIDTLNAGVLAWGRRRSLDEVRREEEEAWAALLALVESAPTGDLFNPTRFPRTEGRPFAESIEANGNGHYAEHLPELQAWLR